ncbi:MAG: hypothetical protein HFE94_00150 [Acutalibacter sp.]|nr:hypothetical protein [Acutalibacter sp.]
MNIDLMVQNLLADIASVPQTNQGSEGEDFDALLRQQTKTNQPQKPAEKPKDKQQAEKPKEDSTQEEITQEGYEVAAGLVTSQPVVLFDVVVPAVQGEVVQEVPSVEGAQGMEQVPVDQGQQLIAVEAGVSAEVQEEPVQAEKPVAEPVAELNMAPETEEAPDAPVVKVVQPQSQEADAQEMDLNQKAPAQAGEAKPQFKGEELPQDLEVQTQNSQPLFQQDSPTPVKVAENYEPVELEESTAGEQLSARVTDALEQGLPKVELQLSPASLGNLTVEISKDVNGQLNIVFRPETARAAALLSNSSFHLGHQNADGSYDLAKQAVVVIVHPEEPKDTNQFLNPDGQNRQRHQQEQKEKKRKGASEEFLHQLRLGLVGVQG